MNYFLIAGEASGDLHGAALIREIKVIDRDASFTCFGGDLMQEQGGEILKHYREMAFMGLIPVILNLRTINKNFQLFKEELKLRNPDLLILIDYPGFNLRAAKVAKKLNIPVVYYISPKIWAWKTHRIKQIKANIDRMYTIFPFETSFYEQFNYKVEYVGNPVFDLTTEELTTNTDFYSFCTENELINKPIIALLAGSRKSEISLLIPEMEKLLSHFPNHQFVLAGAPGIDPNYYLSILKSDIKVVYGLTYKLLRNSVAAVVVSGTATLETALLSIPQLVIYKFNFGWMFERLRSVLFKQKYFSLVNLIAEKEVVKEFFQSEVTETNLVTELSKLLNNEEYRVEMIRNYSDISSTLKSAGAAKNAAKSIVEFISKR